MSVSLSTHVLDVERGRPASGVRVELWRDDLLTAGETDADGRIAELASDLEPGVYRLLFRPDSPFFRGVGVEVELEDGHYHVPLLVSSYACTTYRGSRAGSRRRPGGPHRARVPEPGLRGEVRLPLRRLRQPALEGRDPRCPPAADRAHTRGGAGHGTRGSHRATANIGPARLRTGEGNR